MTQNIEQIAEALNNLERLIPYSKQITKESKMEILINYMTEFVKDLNNELKEKNIVVKNIVTFSRVYPIRKEDIVPENSYGISLFSYKVKNLFSFSVEDNPSEVLKSLSLTKDEIIKEAYDMAWKIHDRRKDLKEFFKDIFNNVIKKDTEHFNPDLLSYSFDTYYTYSEGIYIFSIYYNGSLLYGTTIHAYLDNFFNKEIFKATIKEKILTELNKKKEEYDKAKSNEIIEFATSVLKGINLKVTKDLPNNIMYDLKKRVVSLNFDLKDEDLKKQFKEDVQKEINKIYNFEKIDTLTNELEDYHLSKRYRYSFITEKHFDEDVYTLYSCKATHNKDILHIFKNGKRLKGNQRKKAITMIGYGRKK